MIADPTPPPCHFKSCDNAIYMKDDYDSIIQMWNYLNSDTCTKMGLGSYLVNNNIILLEELDLFFMLDSLYAKHQNELQNQRSSKTSKR